MSVNTITSPLLPSCHSFSLSSTDESRKGKEKAKVKKVKTNRETVPSSIPADMCVCVCVGRVGGRRRRLKVGKKG